MPAIDYVGILGDKPLPTEIFVGLFDTPVQAGTGGTVPGSEVVKVLDALWSAQSALIEEESAYVTSLNAIFKDKHIAVPKQENIISEIIGDIITSGLSKLAAWIVFSNTANPYIAAVAMYAIEFAIEKAIHGLRTFLVKGQKICSAITAENEALLTLENSVVHYELRREAMKLHTEQIENILHHINSMEKQLTDALNGEDTSTSDDWEKWIEKMEESTGGIERWLEDAFAAADVNYDDDPETSEIQIPDTPSLPALPPTSDPKLIALSLLMRFGTKIVVELLKNWIEKGHGKNHEEMLLAVKDLKYNDEMIDLGGVRVWHKAKVIEYG